MARTCQTCEHRERKKIDKLLVAGDLSLRKIAELFGVSPDSIRHHKNNHLLPHLAESHKAAEISRADRLLDDVDYLYQKSLTILSRAEKSNDLSTALAAIRQARGNLDLLARLYGKVKDHLTVNVLINPQWIEIRTAILTALSPYPEARAAVVEALQRIDKDAG